MSSSLDTKDEAKLRFDEEPECRELLKNLQLDELMLAAVLLSERYPKSIPKDKNALIQTCINELASIKWVSEKKRLTNTLESIQEYASTADQSQWIKDPMPKRLEAFLRNQLSYEWIDTDGISNKKQFLMMYNLEVIRSREGSRRDRRGSQSSLRKLKNDWSRIESLNELKGVKKANYKDFLEHFSKEYKKIALENEGRNALRKVNSTHLETIEDALIWLDLFSDNPLERSAITDKILKSWQQKQYRKTSGKIQKNFNLSEATISTFKKLVDKHNLNETEIITILINEELKNDIYIKEVLNRANALQRAINGE